MSEKQTVEAGNSLPQPLVSSGVEPNVIRATVREADDELHIECRFSDGQKFAAVRVDSDLPELANRIASFLSSNNDSVC